MEDNATYDEPWIEPGADEILHRRGAWGKTALLSKPYSDTPETSGMAVHTDKEIDELVTCTKI